MGVGKRGRQGARAALGLAAATAGVAAGAASAGAEDRLSAETVPPDPQAISSAEDPGEIFAPSTSETARGQAATAALESGGSSPPPPASTIRVALADAIPQRVFFANGHESRFNYRIRGTQKRDLRIVVAERGSGKVIKAFTRRDVAPGSNHRVLWNGVGRNGNLAARGVYRYRIESPGGDPANYNTASGDDTFRFYTDKFPIRGWHSYGDGIGAGRGHRGQDMPSNCGTRLVAARGGRVQYRGYQAGGAGNYAVIDIRGSGRDYVYMHMKSPAAVASGQPIKTGQRIGYVGSTGHSTGCHLHFEMWSAPGWYEGGNFMNPAPYLRTWDRYS